MRLVQDEKYIKGNKVKESLPAPPMRRYPFDLGQCHMEREEEKPNFPSHLYSRGSSRREELRGISRIQITA